MKSRKDIEYYPLWRSAFENCEELAEVIKKSSPYVYARMAGHELFSRNDKVAILEYLGKDWQKVGVMDKYFPDYVHENYED